MAPLDILPNERPLFLKGIETSKKRILLFGRVLRGKMKTRFRKALDMRPNARANDFRKGGVFDVTCKSN
jgi:hypothetical protein